MLNSTIDNPNSVETSSLLSSHQNKQYYHSIIYKSQQNSISDICQEQSDNSEENKNNSTTNKNEQNLSIFTFLYWHSIINQYSSSIYLENKASVARDHLANERTYLAWLRTSLSIISVGIGITQLFRLEKKTTQTRHYHQQDKASIYGQMIGFLFIIISILFLVFAFIRYFHTQLALTKGYFPASRSTVLIASSLLFFTMVFVLIIVFKVQQ
ncbi:uncharacterized protein BX663DRAFT_492388 [Cokeromyces recurvatus]|uniref:uncharacterized protein n=1 Tax=Cokeromyces recurvatus TaxID=90255 RepID=UPI00221EC682|nr:uncharacterized protein BX663DRAFT_492388 [Cokeromyces recurvatus]KAI7907913.1 hypothetical protein BX663DRAFT_492388 [Cokeromyces recurvatus]